MVRRSALQAVVLLLVAGVGCNGSTIGAPHDGGAHGPSDAGASSDGGMSPAGACPNGDGLFCGGDGVLGDIGTLYQCMQGAITVSQVCANGCAVNRDGGSDTCADVPAAACPAGDGTYCGGHGVSGDAGTLYQCTGGKVSVSKACPSACQEIGAGGADQCRSQAAGCPNGDGTYCGGDGNAGDPSTLYQCSQGAFTPSKVCQNGCEAFAPGGADQCAGAPVTSCPNGDGTYCGGDGNPGPKDMLYQCQSGQFSADQLCLKGCQAGAMGGSDQCAAASSCPSGDGTYCGSDLSGGAPGMLYQCAGGKATIVQTCSNGCQAGTPGKDQCVAPPACPNGDGLYCGGDGNTGTPGDLYQCTGGRLALTQSCPNGCQDTPPGGTDVCAASEECPNGDGLYCGGNGIDGDGNTLFRCAGGHVTIAQSCAMGCLPRGNGGNDACGTGALDGGCPAGDGTYCGGDNVMGDSSTLYQCTAGTLARLQTCMYGCNAGPPGGGDECLGGDGMSCPDGDGTYCAADLGTGNPNTLYLCVGGIISISEPCSAGCTAGTPGVDGCTEPPANACPNGDGTYCGGDNVMGDVNTLYQCSNGNITVGLVCPNGCQASPPGGGDQCLQTGTCPHGDGTYCGDGYMGSTNTLYQCTSGVFTEMQACPAGCASGTPGHDACARATSCPSGDGLYCGGDHNSGDAKTLYRCTGGSYVVSQLCLGTCTAGTPGHDTCSTAATCPHGDGAYCGTDLGQGDADTLYHCQQGQVTVAQRCQTGCNAGTPGSDQCAPEAAASCPNGDGTYCGGDGVDGTTGTLYRCLAGATTVAETCSNGCQSGTPGRDQCAPAASCPNGDGLYCGGDDNTQPAGTLYQCSGGTFTVAQACPNGCQSGTPGSDQCQSQPSGCPHGDGTYCGGDGAPGDPQTLYLCANGTYAILEVCSAGCQSGTPGNDACAPAPTCPNGDGTYCGSTLGIGDPKTLYECSSGTLTVAQTCADGCQSLPPGGGDSCLPPPHPQCPNGDGTYCGGNGISGDPDTLYLCSQGTTMVSQICMNGCSPGNGGGSDQCLPAPVSLCPNGDGVYCGDDLGMGDPNTLYQCAGTSLTEIEMCANGCHSGSPGNDLCNPPMPTCPNGDGTYCGGNGTGGDPDTLYDCAAGVFTVKEACISGCEATPPGGGDACAPTPATCPNGNGLYCGGDGNSGDVSTLYQCTNGRFSMSKVCVDGCQVKGNGGQDQCVAVAPTCPNGNGLYCGGNGNGGDPTKLYQCTDGTFTEKQQCMNGCLAGAGGSDLCSAPGLTCPSGNGLYCGGDQNTGEPGTLFQCTGGIWMVSERCADGCTSKPPGGKDECAPAPPTCPHGDGTYCGGDNNKGSTDSLYQCSKGQFTLKQKCSLGCDPKPPGGDDQCKTPTCPAGTGTYCGGDNNPGKRGTLYECKDGKFTAKQTCHDGCQVKGKGSKDVCAPKPKPGVWKPGHGKPSAKGLWIWEWDYIGMSAKQAAEKAKADGIGWVLIKSGEDDAFWSTRYNTSTVKEFTSRGIVVMAWVYVRPTSIAGTITAIREALDVPGTSGVILDAEVEWEGPYAGPAQQLCEGIRKAKRGAFVGYTSFGWIGYHPSFPWKTFDAHCGDAFLPQVYWSNRGVSWSYGYNQALQMIHQERLHAPNWIAQSNNAIYPSSNHFPSTADLNAFFAKSGAYSTLWEFPVSGETGEVNQLKDIHWKN